MDIESAALDVLRKNRRETSGYQYTVPSPDTYPYQWLWDSCFHAIVLAEYEPEFAVAELRALLSHQFDNGMLPHMIYWQPGTLHRYEWGAEHTSTLTQPPMIAYAAWEIYRHTNNLGFLESLYPRLLRYYEYLIMQRDPQDHHLIGIINPDESGEDNSSRFDSALKVPDDISYDDHLSRRLELVDANKACKFDAELCMHKYFWVKDVPFNAIMVENLRILSHMASLLGKQHDEHFCKLHADLISQAMREYLFENGVFFSMNGQTYEKIPTVTWAHFAPLFADLYSPEEAGVLIDQFLGNEDTLCASWGVRSVSKLEPSYRANGFWRGPVWMAPHWFIYRGLRRYGFTKEAGWVRDKSIALLEKSGFREYFNPETGEGYGAHEFTWGALVLDMLD